MIAVKDLKDNRLYLISGFRERYTRKIWEQELGLKKIDKHHLKTICNDGICTITEHSLLIIFKEEHFKTACNYQKRIIINLTESKEKICKNSLLNINKQDLKNNGSYMIWINGKNINIKSNKNYRLQKPWETSLYAST